jgi:hypothetical protein
MSQLLTIPDALALSFFPALSDGHTQARTPLLQYGALALEPELLAYDPCCPFPGGRQDTGMHRQVWAGLPISQIEAKVLFPLGLG